MEWVVLLLQVILFGCFLAYESYFKEKGKNLATKEDIGKITEEVQSVKKFFDESLENHKSKLLRDFEESKHIIALCQKIDGELIDILLTCHILNEESKLFGGIQYLYKDDYKDCLQKLAYFLTQYKYRYMPIDIAKKIIITFNDIDILILNKDQIECTYYEDGEEFSVDEECLKYKEQILWDASILLSYFLPPLPPKKVGE